jgi:uncharacterized protein (DUF433 family)
VSLAIEKQSVPLTTTPDGTVVVTGTRVQLDTIIGAFQEGAVPEEIVHQYTSLSLADVYAVIGYYLRHRDEVDAYLRTRTGQRAKVRAENESRHDPRGVRHRLLARRGR